MRSERPRLSFRNTEVLPSKKESIFQYYSVPNEISFVQNLDRNKVSREDSHYYITENVSRFLGEFAGKVPYTSISYAQSSTDLEYAGMSLLPSYKRTAEIAGPGSREHDEYIGFENVRKALLQGKDHVVWISPPKIADYGFLFYFQRDGDDPSHVKEYVLRYGEKMGELGESETILSNLDPELSLKTDSDFLQNPVSFKNLGLGDVLRAIGISEAQIEDSLAFDDIVRQDLTPWIDAYVNSVFDGNVQDAQTILSAIYNRALDLKKQVEKEPGYFPQDVGNMQMDTDDLVFMVYAKQEAVVRGGGSCPVTQASWGDPLSPTNIAKSLTQQKTPNSVVTEASGFVCPRCDFHATKPVGDQCPNCDLTKEEHAKAGGVVC